MNSLTFNRNGINVVIGVSFHPDDQEIIEDVKKESPGLQSAPGIDTNKKCRRAAKAP